VANVVDPLGGSYFVEKLTDEIEADAEEIFAEIEEQGGVVPGSRRLVPAARSPARPMSTSSRDRARGPAHRRGREPVPKDGSNLMPRFLDAVKAYATLGEIVRVLKQEFGEYVEPPTF
jgi:methylmalonyl-CoA mutase N-terminal domain/subunit